MTGDRKSHTVRNAEDDLMGVGRPKAPGEGRCVPLATGAMALPVCKGEQHKAEGYEHSFGEEIQKTEGAEKGKQEETSGDESLNDQ